MEQKEPCYNYLQLLRTVNVVKECTVISTLSPKRFWHRAQNGELADLAGWKGVVSPWCPGALWC